ncbi:hypothetical protein Q3G72_025208 [Acer saccharum]|nr:hypothetical protein Q3G72_025208 [Acer saccharum]
MKQQSFLFYYLLLALICVVGSSNGALLPFVDPPGNLLSDIWADPFRVLEQIPIGVERDENTGISPTLARAKLDNGVLTLSLSKLSPDKIKGPRVVTIAGGDSGPARLKSTDNVKQEL